MKQSSFPSEQFTFCCLPTTSLEQDLGLEGVPSTPSIWIPYRFFLLFVLKVIINNNFFLGRW